MGKIPRFCLQAIGGEIVKKSGAPDMRLWNVRIDGANLRLVFDDFPMMISLESSDQEGDVVIERLHQRLQEGDIPVTIVKVRKLK